MKQSAKDRRLVKAWNKARDENRQHQKRERDAGSFWGGKPDVIWCKDNKAKRGATELLA